MSRQHSPMILVRDMVPDSLREKGQWPIVSPLHGELAIEQLTLLLEKKRNAYMDAESAEDSVSAMVDMLEIVDGMAVACSMSAGLDWYAVVHDERESDQSDEVPMSALLTTLRRLRQFPDEAESCMYRCAESLAAEIVQEDFASTDVLQNKEAKKKAHGGYGLCLYMAVVFM